MTVSMDAILIGAGLYGASVAFYLAQRGWKVAVFEKGLFGRGATGHSSGIVQQHYTHPVIAQLAVKGLYAYQNFKEEVGGECGFVNSGHLVLTMPQDQARLCSNVASIRSHGIEVEILDSQEIRHRWPQLRIEEHQIGAYTPASGFADPNLTLNSYINRARSMGAKITIKTPVTQILFENGKAQGVIAANEYFTAPVVVNCGGVWSAQVARKAGVELPIFPSRIQIGLFRCPHEHKEPLPVIADFAHGVYWRSETGNIILLGGMLDFYEEINVTDPDSYNSQVEMDFLADAGERMVRRYPAMETADCLGGYAALCAVTPDRYPIIDQVPPGSGFYICAGFSGQGFKFGPVIGRMVADLITGEKTIGINSDIFRLCRFEKQDLIRNQYEYTTS